MQLELYINDTLADIREESIIAVTKTYETVENPLNYYCEYTKTVKLPISERNNAIFSNFNRQDSIVTNVTADYTKKFSFRLLNAGENVMTGTLQLNNANTIYTDECYEVTMFSTLGDIMNTLGLLTFNPNAVEVDPQYVIASPFNTLQVNRNLVKNSFEQESHSLDGNGVLDWIGFIPTYQGKYDDFSSDKEQIMSSGRTEDMTQERDEHYVREFRSYYQQPFIWVDKLWKVAKEKIESITDYSFNLDRSWFTPDNPYYTDLIYTCPSLFNADDNYSAQNVNFTPKLNQWTFNKPTRDQNAPLSQTVTRQLTGLQAYTPSELFSGNIFNPHADLGPTKFHGDFRFTLYAPLNDYEHDTQYARIRTDNPFYVTFKAVNVTTGEEIYGARKKFMVYSGKTSQSTAGYECMDVGICDRTKPDVSTPVSNRPILYSGTPVTGTPHSTGDGYYWECNMEVDLNVQENVPYRIYVDVRNYNNDKPFEWASIGWTPRWDWAWKDFWENTWITDRGYSMYLDLSNGYAETLEHHRSSSDLNLYRIFPQDTTLRDVLLNYSKMFGLVWDVDEDDKSITVMSRNRFFTDYNVMDWSDKVDRSREFKMQPLTFDHKYVIFNYEEGECGRLKSYEAKYQATYGAKKLDTEYEFNVDENELFEGLVSSIVCQKKQVSCMMNTEYEKMPNFMGFGYKVLPNEHYVDNDDEGKNAGMSGAFYFRNGTFEPDPQVSPKDHNGNYCIIITDDTEHQIATSEYCWNSTGENWALCYKIPDVSTISNVYNENKYSVHFEQPVEYYYKASGAINYLYNSYWKNYIDERYCSQNKKLTGYFYISPKEFAELDFREFVKIDNVLYHIDKVYDYDFNADKPVKMDLAQVWDITNYTGGQLSLTYLFTVPETITLSSTDTTNYQTVDVYCSGEWTVLQEAVPSWVTASKYGNDLRIKPNSTTLVAREGYVFLGYTGTDWRVKVKVRQTPPPVCRLDVDRDTLVFGWNGDSDIVEIDTSNTALNAISVSSNRGWLKASVTEYDDGTAEAGGTGPLHLQVKVNGNIGANGRNGTITLTMACGGTMLVTLVNVGQQGVYDAEEIVRDEGIITNLYSVLDGNRIRVNKLTAGTQYHFKDIFGEQIDVNSLYITNGTVAVTGNAGEQDIIFTPQLSDGDTCGGGVITATTLNGKTITYNYNVESTTPAPTSRRLYIAAQNGLFRVTRNGTQGRRVSNYEKVVNDGEVFTVEFYDVNNYHFVKWLDSNSVAHTDNPYTFVVSSSLADADGNIKIKAIFSDSVPITTSTITIQASNGYFTVGNDQTHYRDYSRTVENGTVVTNITVVPDADYTFVGWSDGSQQNHRDYQVYQDTTLVAIFEYTGTEEYFYVEDASGATNTLSVRKASSSEPTVTVYTSTDQSTWTLLGSTSTTALTATVPTNGKLYLKATANTWGGNLIACSRAYNIGGNIMSLLNGDDYSGSSLSNSNNTYAFAELFKNSTTLASANNLVLPANTKPNCYYGLFRGCTNMTTAPVLPAIPLSANCYNQMFRDCSSLTAAPELPATTMAEGAYGAMFQNCTSLTAAPTLPATTLAPHCYAGLFTGCTALTNAPALPATVLFDQCYRTMFYGCTSLTTAPALPATTVAPYSYADMFNGCTGLTIAPALPATTLADNCYNQMFFNCVSLVTPPTLPATALADYSYQSMFWGCSNLSYIITYADDISATSCIDNWLYSVAPVGNFYNLGSATYTVDSPSGIPLGWTDYHTPPTPTPEPPTPEPPTPEPPVPTVTGYFYIEDASGADNTLTITKNGSTAPTIEVYTSTDQSTWTLMGSTSTSGITATVPANGKLYLKATANSWCVYDYGNKYNYIDCSDSYNVGGNIMSLLYDNDFTGKTAINYSRAFCSLFKNSATLLSASDLELVATRLQNSCYAETFSGCTSLTTPPTLPATALADYSYQNLFSGCTGLATAPALPATSLATGCYQGMMSGCTSLTTTPSLPATSLVANCYQNMFSGCSLLSVVTTYANDISATNCIDNWLYGVAATGDFYNEGEATYVVDSPSGIPLGWTEHKPVPTVTGYFYVEDTSGSNSTLTIAKSYGDAPTLTIYKSTDQFNWTSMGSTSTSGIRATIPANGKLYLKCTADSWAPHTFYNRITASGTHNVGGNIMSLLYGDNFINVQTLASINNFLNLFRNDTNLQSAANLQLPATSLSNGCYNGMFSGCVNLTAAPVLPATTLATGCYYGMFEGCTSLTTAPVLPATTLAQLCYCTMFASCSALTTAPALPATTMAENCYYRMFLSCRALTTAPVLPATTLADGCYYGMFYACDQLVTAPVLPATVLAPNCYRDMFLGCDLLNAITAYANDISASYCLESWLYGVSATGDFYNLGTATYPEGAGGIPFGWTEHTSL